MNCKAVENGEVKRKGDASIEYYDNGKPVYYCIGWLDNDTEELRDTCKKCKKNVIYAQDDLDKM